jgi:tRNA G18 (ribose-2'-O)-methylase SpoU
VEGDEWLIALLGEEWLVVAVEEVSDPRNIGVIPKAARTECAS